jgi:hypothetical protein
MEDILTQRFNYATITVFKDYCKISDKKKSLNSKSVDLDVFDDEEEKVRVTRPIDEFNIFFEDFTKPKVGRIVEFPEKMGKRKTRFFYGDTGINEQTTINYALHNFQTTNDRHIKRHYGNPFSEITVNTIERSIRRHGDKVTIKVYRHTSHRGFNNIYFRKSTSVQSVTFNMLTGNFTTLNMNKEPKSKNTLFRTNNFGFLVQAFKQGGILDMRQPLDEKSVLFNDYTKTFNNSDFVFQIDKVFKLNQNFVFNGKWFVQLMLERFVELKKIKVSNDYGYWIANYYPTEKFLKKNERKLVASILDMFQIKSKITIKIMHDNNKIDIHTFARLCYFFGDNFSKYIGSIDRTHFKNMSHGSEILAGPNKFHFANEMKSNHFEISNIEKENIVKIINNVKPIVRGFEGLSPRETPIKSRFIDELYDHFNMIKKLRKYDGSLYLKSKTYDDFHNEHMELSKMMSFIKKGWVIEYKFDDKMEKDVETPIDLKIDLGDDKFGDITFYPHILKREEEYDEEGRFMHHCVASYSDKEKSIIVSLRTLDKQDRITCEFHCQDGTLLQARHFCNKQPPADMLMALDMLKPKMTKYARLGILHSLDKKKVPIKINGVEVIPEKKEVKPDHLFDRLFERRLPF